VVGVIVGTVLIGDDEPPAAETAGPAPAAPDPVAERRAVRPPAENPPQDPATSDPVRLEDPPPPVTTDPPAKRVIVEGDPGQGPDGAVPRELSPVDRKLAMLLTLAFDGATGAEVIAYIADATGVPVVVDPQLDVAAMPVTLQLEDVSAKDALELLAMVLACRLEIGDDAVHLIR